MRIRNLKSEIRKSCRAGGFSGVRLLALGSVVVVALLVLLLRWPSTPRGSTPCDCSTV